MSMTGDALDARLWLEREGFDLAALERSAPAAADVDDILPDLLSYDIALIAFSGGKDSLALLLRLIDLGYPRERIEL